MKDNVKIIDLTHTMSETTPSWDGSCGFMSKICHDYDTKKGVSFRIQKISMSAGIGTHIDAPAHCFSDGTTVDRIPLADLFAPCAMIDVSGFVHEDLKVSVQHIEEWEKKHGRIPKQSIVLIRTGWDCLFSDPQKYRNDLRFPFLCKDSAAYLLQQNIRGIGIDTLSPDRPDGGFPVHEMMLRAGVYILENIANTSAMPALGAHVLALPLKIQGGTEAPVRLVGFMPHRASSLGGC